MNKPTFYIVCGLPGSGKTTLAKQIETKHSAVRFCPDEWMEDIGVSLWDSKVRKVLEDRFRELGTHLLEQGVSIVLEFGFWGQAERDQYRDLGRKLESRVELHYLDTPLDEIKTRLQSRGMEGDKVIIKKITEYAQQFEPPTQDELALYDNHS